MGMYSCLFCIAGVISYANDTLPLQYTIITCQTKSVTNIAQYTSNMFQSKCASKCASIITFFGNVKCESNCLVTAVQHQLEKYEDVMCLSGTCCRS